MTRRLDVYLHDRKAGVLAQDDAGLLGFAYAAEYLSLTDAPRISWSMPLTDQPYDDRVTRPYFAGLLPDETARRKLAGALGVSEGNAFGLLEIIGGECAGALSVYPEGQTPPDLRRRRKHRPRLGRPSDHPYPETLCRNPRRHRAE